jgi:hypothetical protein
MLDRKRIALALQAALEPLPAVASLWEAGSAAFGRADEYSDLDLVADVADGHEDEVFAVVEDTLAALVRAEEPGCAQPILERKAIPQPAFHGMAQRFYKLAATSEWLLIDFCLRPLSKPGHFGEVERHGTPIVYFDKTGAAQTTRLDQAEWKGHLARRVEAMREQFAMFGNFAEKEVRRGRALDAIAMYHGLILRPLLELVRIKYSPERHDFGPRYAQFDLPAEVVSRMERLWYVRDMDDILGKQAEARAWAAELLGELGHAA